jgi:hypothetical protein
VAEIEYLGHLISTYGVRADPLKLDSMVNWPLPQSIKPLIGFLGLTSYYRKFIRRNGVIVSPLTAILKNCFYWTPTATKAFLNLKKAVTSPPILHLPDLTKVFTVECDASGTGIEVVRMQEGQPIAFFSQAFKGQALYLSTYEKKLLSLVKTIQKWRHYLLGQSFKAKTDKQSLKFLIEQKVGTVS